MEKERFEKIRLTIESFFSWRSFSLDLWPLYVIQGWYCEDKIDVRQSQLSKGCFNV